MHNNIHYVLFCNLYKYIFRSRWSIRQLNLANGTNSCQTRWFWLPDSGWDERKSVFLRLNSSSRQSDAFFAKWSHQVISHATTNAFSDNSQKETVTSHIPSIYIYITSLCLCNLFPPQVLEYSRSTLLPSPDITVTPLEHKPVLPTIVLLKAQFFTNI